MPQGTLAFGGGGTSGVVLAREQLAQLAEAGMTCRDAHRFQEARAIFTKICEAFPRHAIGQIGLGTVCFSEGHFAKASDHYRQALKLDPRNAYAYALLGESQIFQEQYASASLSLRRAQELDPRGPYGRLAESLLKFVACLPAQESSL